MDWALQGIALCLGCGGLHLSTWDNRVQARSIQDVQAIGLHTVTFTHVTHAYPRPTHTKVPHQIRSRYKHEAFQVTTHIQHKYSQRVVTSVPNVRNNPIQVWHYTYAQSRTGVVISFGRFSRPVHIWPLGIRRTIAVTLAWREPVRWSWGSTLVTQGGGVGKNFAPLGRGFESHCPQGRFYPWTPQPSSP